MGVRWIALDFPRLQDNECDHLRPLLGLSQTYYLNGPISNTYISSQGESRRGEAAVVVTEEWKSLIGNSPPWQVVWEYSSLDVHVEYVLA
jgi:hypothetical protein